MRLSHRGRGVSLRRAQRRRGCAHEATAVARAALVERVERQSAHLELHRGKHGAARAPTTHSPHRRSRSPSCRCSPPATFHTCPRRSGRTGELLCWLGRPVHKGMRRDVVPRRRRSRRRRQHQCRRQRLRKRRLGGSQDDEQPALGEGAHAGTYFDEIFLNKRTGYFMIYLLSYFGSINLADPSNTYNVKAKSILPGDVLIK